jgi:crotonobetainyl-CoA:carnitine CoA-transferase CaiB-like acyl-CoA transferase
VRPFENLRVLDLTHVLAGPYCTYQLALLGAEVIKVEEPGLGEYMRRRGADAELKRRLMGDHFISQNANKRSIVLDLKTQAGQEIAAKLARRADVVVENYRKGVARRWKLDYETLSKTNPRLIYCSLKAFGATGPWSDRPGWDHTVQAASGIMGVTGTATSGPLKVGAPVFDYASGIMAAFAVSAALLQRERSGLGQFIDVSMLDTALALMTPLVTSFLHTGQAPGPHANEHALAAGSCYETKEGGLIMLGAIMQRQFEAFCNRIGREDLLSDPRFRSVIDQDPHRAPLAEEIARTMKTRTAHEWETLLAPDIPAVRVRTFAEAVSSDYVAARPVLQKTPVPGLDQPMTVPLAGFAFAHDGPRLDTPPPGMGENTRAILAELGYDGAAIDTLLAEKAAVAPK